MSPPGDMFERTCDDDDVIAVRVVTSFAARAAGMHE